MVVAVVVPKPGEKIEEEELKAFFRKNLADYKCPKAVIFSEDLPMNTSGKILKRALREKYAGRAEHF